MLVRARPPETGHALTGSARASVGQEDGGSWGTSGPRGMGRAQPLAVTMNGGVAPVLRVPRESHPAKGALPAQKSGPTAGGMAIGYSIHAGMVVVANGTPQATCRQRGS